MASKKNSKAPASKEQGVDLSFIGSQEETAESRSIASRKRLREQVSNEVEAFLKRGGKINHVEAHATADPPRKPGGSYGSRPI